MSSFKRMTRTDLMRNYPAKVAVNEQTLSIAREQSRAFGEIAARKGGCLHRKIVQVAANFRL